MFKYWEVCNYLFHLGIVGGVELYAILWLVTRTYLGHINSFSLHMYSLGQAAFNYNTFCLLIVLSIALV